MKGNNNPSKVGSLKLVISEFFYFSSMKTISIICSTKEINNDYLKHVKKHFSHPKNEYFFIENNGDTSLSSLYNDYLKKTTNDIVIFIHDDLIFETKNITPKIINLFESNPEFGIIGLAGTDKLKTGVWWDDRNSMYGIVGHENNGKRHVNHYSAMSFPEKPKEVVIVDGLFIAVHKKRIKNTFNEDFLGFHYYDLPICVENFIEGVKIGVTTKIRVTHKSIGMVNEKWVKNKILFETLYKKYLPLSIN